MVLPRRFLDSDITRYLEAAPRAKENDPAQQVLDKLRDSPSGAVLVTSQDEKKLVGIITKSDLVKVNIHSDPPQTAKDLATTQNVIAIRDDAHVWQLLQIMNGENSFKRRLDVLPVVKAGNEPVGAIFRDKLRLMMPSEVADAGM